MIGFNTIQERDAYMAANADYFTAVRYRGVGLGYERHECKSLKEAEELAAELANEAGRPYIIYAVKDLHDAYVTTKKPKDW